MDIREVMTPRVDVTYLTIPVHAEDIARAVRSSGHSCFPVVHDDLDDLIGILFVNDIFRTGGGASGPRTRNDGNEPKNRDATDPSPLEISRKVRQPYLLPESLGVLEALADMRKHHRAVAVVVDEYGGVAGMLTVKDLLEPLVGDLHDEFDEEEEAHIVRVDNTRWLIDGQANVDDVRERVGIADPRRGVRHPGWTPVRALRPHPRRGRGGPRRRLGPQGGRDGQAPRGAGRGDPRRRPDGGLRGRWRRRGRRAARGRSWCQRERGSSRLTPR